MLRIVQHRLNFVESVKNGIPVSWVRTGLLDHSLQKSQSIVEPDHAGKSCFKYVTDQLCYSVLVERMTFGYLVRYPVQEHVLVSHSVVTLNSKSCRMTKRTCYDCNRGWTKKKSIFFSISWHEKKNWILKWLGHGNRRSCKYARDF